MACYGTPVSRRLNFQNIAWFWDLHQRSTLNLEPKYQRRSVWSPAFKEAFIDTILRQYPAPAIFLFEDVESSGRAVYHVVDGKQRLLSIIDFVNGVFPIGDSFANADMRGKYFEQLDPKTKTEFWSYQLAVDYLPSSEEGQLHEIFERINKNIAKLTPQELRHARLGGEFIRAAEDLTRWLAAQLPDVPRIASQQRNQMKDVELTAQLLLYLEEGTKSHSQDELDIAFVTRDEEWTKGSRTQDRFREIIRQLGKILDGPTKDELLNTRIVNQTDFYSLYGAIDAAMKIHPLQDGTWAARLLSFFHAVDDTSARTTNAEAERYYKAARSNSNDQGQRRERIEILTRVLTEG